MNSARLAAVVTPVVIIALLIVVVARKKQAAKVDANPRDTIYATLEAARAGDSKAYLDLYAGPTRASLDQTFREKGGAGFGNYLKSSTADLKGLAVFDPKPTGEGTVEVRVEYVYQDRNEAQILQLEKSRSGWKIVQVLNAERVKTLVPYGTPVQ